jgi:hypothetical protein
VNEHTENGIGGKINRKGQDGDKNSPYKTEGSN